MTDLEPLTHRLADDKAALLGRQSEPGFWGDRRTALSILDRAQRLDRLLSDAGRLARDIERTERNRDPRRQAAFVSTHNREYDRLRQIFEGGDLRDAALFIERVGPACELDAVGLMVRLYQGLASRLHLEAEQVDDVRTDESDRAVLIVSGAGAAQLLTREAGLHRFRSGDGHRRVEENVAVRVAPLDMDATDEGITTSVVFVSLDGRIGGRKRALVRASDLVHEGGSIEIVVPVITSLDRDGLEELARSLLVARRNTPPTALGLVRRYDLGSSPVVTDLRTGARSGRVGDVLAGNLDVLDKHHIEGLSRHVVR